MKDLAVFVMACDKYEFIYKPFFYFAKKNLPLPFYFFTEGISGKDYTPIGDLAWNERLDCCLQLLNSYSDILFLQEDFLIKNVNMPALEAAYDFHKKKKAQITKLGNNYEFNCSPIGKSIYGLSVYLQNFADEYLLSHQPVAIYNREFLLQTISEKTDNASMHEWVGSNIMREKGFNKVFCIGPKFNPNKSLIFEIEHAIRGGKLLPAAERLINDITYA
jgi:hypothetical protein